MNARLFDTVVQTRELCLASADVSVSLKRLGRNIAEQLIEKGLATALRHKRDDEDRASDYDKLMAAEQA